MKRNSACWSLLYSPVSKCLWVGCCFQQTQWMWLHTKKVFQMQQDIPVGLQWNMINLGTQGQVKPEDQV